jgi:hypothetical protein
MTNPVLAAVQNFFGKIEPLIANNVSRDDWIGFLDALGWMENRGRYGGLGGFNNAYAGMYQVGNSYLGDLGFNEGTGIFFGGTTLGDFANNPIAQDMAAIMEFSGIPDIGKSFDSRYTAVLKQFKNNGFSDTNISQLIGQTFTINYIDESGQVVMSDTIALTEAGISAAAHLIGQGAMANAMTDIWNQCFNYDAQGNEIKISSIVTLQLTPVSHVDKNGNTYYTYDYCDGNNVTFSTYVKLLQGFDISTLTNATDGLTEFNQLAQDLITAHKDKILSYLQDNHQEVGMSITAGTTNYLATIRSVMLALGLPSDSLDTIDGNVILSGGDATKSTDKADLIIGLGAGEHNLSGGGGNDKIYSGAGNDLLTGGGGADILYGGAGYDTYNAGAGDTITDSDGRGVVNFNGAALSGGKRKKGELVYKSDDGRYSYLLQGTTLTINGAITVKDFHKGQLGINLTEERDRPPEYKFVDLVDGDMYDDPDDSTYERGELSKQLVFPRPDPLVLDLNGNGTIDTVGLSAGIQFDHNGSGVKQATGWIATGDGFLVMDRNGNGIIDNGTEMFGNSSPLSAGGTAADGFASLAQEDTNHDSVINEQDANYANIKVWQDLNQDGISQANELTSLADAGIASLSVFNQPYIDFMQTNDNIISTWGGGYIRADGTWGRMVDINFASDSFTRTFSDSIPITQAAQSLPATQGSGTVRMQWWIDAVTVNYGKAANDETLNVWRKTA